MVLGNTVAPVLAFSEGQTIGSRLLSEGSSSFWNSELAGTVETSPLAAATQPTCAPGTFTLTGNTATDGSDGNIRSFTATGGTRVKVSAFSRKYDNGLWETAYLGSYGSGLGVTDRGENGADPNYKVDNVGSGSNRRNNYVLFEFDRSVVVDKAFLDSITTDSDISVWVGTRNDPYNNHLSNLSDSILSGFGRENDDGGSSSRDANFNNSNEVGNVVVIASNPDGTNDQFKIKTLSVTCAATPTPTPTPTPSPSPSPSPSPTPVPCFAGALQFIGNSATDGDDGNVRTFTLNGVTATVNAWSLRKDNFALETAYLGLYPGGLGVTDRGEASGSNNRYKVDNLDRWNFVAFKFNSVIVPDKAFLANVANDSDIVVFVANVPTTTPMTIQELLQALNQPVLLENNDGGGSNRIADFNAGNVHGNVLIIGARIDGTQNDEFTISNLEFTCPGGPTPTPTPTPTASTTTTVPRP